MKWWMRGKPYEIKTGSDSIDIAIPGYGSMKIPTGVAEYLCYTLHFAHNLSELDKGPSVRIGLSPHTWTQIEQSIRPEERFEDPELDKKGKCNLVYPCTLWPDLTQSFDRIGILEIVECEKENAK